MTAIVRFRHSKPVLLALSHSIIEPSTSVFDYGCGRGEDVKYLRSQGIQASGWDPHYQPDTAPATADVVNLGYVLNVIEDPIERQATLLESYRLARRVLIVVVRVDHALLETGIEFSDGLLTSRGSFQKLYKQSEFRKNPESSLGKRPHMVALGIAYIFKDEALESSYLVSLSHKRVEASSRYAVEQFSTDATAQKYVHLTEQLGRPPLPGEFEDYAELLERFGSPERIDRLASRILSPNGINEVQQKRREDILHTLRSFACRELSRFFSIAPSRVTGRHRDALAILFRCATGGRGLPDSIGDPEIVRSCCQSCPVGKKLPDALYLHRSAEDQLGALLRLLAFAARQIVGEVDYNVLKISMDGRSISFLTYR